MGIDFHLIANFAALALITLAGPAVVFILFFRRGALLAAAGFDLNGAAVPVAGEGCWLSFGLELPFLRLEKGVAFLRLGAGLPVAGS